MSSIEAREREYAETFFVQPIRGYWTRYCWHRWLTFSGWLMTVVCWGTAGVFWLEAQAAPVAIIGTLGGISLVWALESPRWARINRDEARATWNRASAPAKQLVMRRGIPAPPEWR